MASNAATVLIVSAGTITFANEWYQTKKLNWRVPVATVLAAAIFDGIAHIDSTAATSLAAISFLTAMTTEFNGKSAAATVAKIYGPQKTKVTVV
jgi:hypothetical protein